MEGGQNNLSLMCIKHTRGVKLFYPTAQLHSKTSFLF
jgi:hypothetical protein